MIMNLYILFLISLPEAVLNLYIILQLVGQKSLLNFRDKGNIFRYIAALALMLVSSLVIRPIVPNAIVNIIVHSIAYMGIIFAIYRTGVLKSIFCVSLVLMLNSAIENIYFPFIVVYASGGYDNFIQNYKWFVVYSIPYRLAQVGIILLLHKYEIVFDMMKINKRFYKLFVAFMYLLTFMEFCFSTIIYKYFDRFELFYQIVFCISLSTLVFITSILIFNLIYFSVTGVLIRGYKQYKDLEDNARMAFSEVYGFLKDQKVDDATRYLENLLGESNNNSINGGDEK